jgi:hypothetical protein
MGSLFNSFCKLLQEIQIPALVKPFSHLLMIEEMGNTLQKGNPFGLLSHAPKFGSLGHSQI